MMSPRFRSGTWIVASTSGSSRTGPASSAPFRMASEPAIWNAMSLESTVWYLPSTSVTFASRFGCDGQGISGAGQVDRRQRAAVLQPEGVARQRVGELGGGCDVARVHLGGGDMLLAARQEDLRQPLLAAAADVGEVSIGLHGAGHDLEVADTAELVAASAEDECLDRLVGLGVGRRH